MRFFRRYNCGDLGRIMIMRKRLDVRMIVIGNIAIIWDAREKKGGTA